MCIEYNGKQHYVKSEIYGGEKRFKNQIKNDSIKKKFCEDSGISLLIIPYTQKKDIEKILKKFL